MTLRGFLLALCLAGLGACWAGAAEDNVFTLSGPQEKGLGFALPGGTLIVTSASLGSPVSADGVPLSPALTRASRGLSLWRTATPRPTLPLASSEELPPADQAVFLAPAPVPLVTLTRGSASGLTGAIWVAVCDSPVPIGAPLVSLAKSEVIGLAVRTDKQGIIIAGLANLKLLCFDAGVELTRSEAAETIPHFLGNWPYGGANASEFRLSDLRTLEEWRDVAGLLPTSQSSLLVADGLLYFGDNSQEFYCVDSERRGLVWSQQLRAPVIFAPALDAARVYATVVSLELEVEAKTVLWTERHWYAQGRSILYAFDRRTGEVRWTHTTGFRTTPLVQEGRVYFGGLTGYGVLEAETGKSVWIQDSPLSRKELPFWYVLGKPTRDTLPVLAVRLRQRMDPKWILRAEGDTKVLFVEAATGKTQKEIPLPRVPMSDHPFAASAVFSPTLDRVTVAVGNAVRAYRLPEGTLLWERPLAGSVVPGAVLQENRWFLPLDAPGVACINLETGQQEWAFQQMTGAPGALTLQDGTLLFGALDSNLYALSAAKGELTWKLECPGGRISGAPAVLGDILYAAASDGRLYAVAWRPPVPKEKSM